MEANKKIIKSVWYLSLGVVLFSWIFQGWPLLATLDLGSVTLLIARLFGLMSAFLVLTQFMLIGRIGWIERAWGQDKLAWIHHKIGKYVLYCILLHMTLVGWSYSISSGHNIVSQFLDFFKNYDDTLNSFLAACLFIVIALISIFFKRLKLKYEVWYFIHLLVYLAILLAWGHQLKLGGTLQNKIISYYWISLYTFVLVNFIYFRFMRIGFLFSRHMFYVSKVVKEAGSATSIYISGKNMEQFKRQSGQFMIVRFLDFKRWWQAHPFSLSWGDNNNELRITAKDSGDFTHDLGEVKTGTYVLIDGMLGKFTLEGLSKKKILLIAGGIGITPIRSLFEKVATSYDCILLWSAKSSSEFSLRGEIEALSKVNKSPVYYFVTESKASGNNEFTGRIDENYIKKLVNDLQDREVFVCGPLPFMMGTKDILTKLGVKVKFIHFEEFSLH